MVLFHVIIELYNSYYNSVQLLIHITVFLYFAIFVCEVFKY